MHQLFTAVSRDGAQHVLVTCCMYESASVLVIARHSMSSRFVKQSNTAADTSFISNASTWDVEEEGKDRGGGGEDCSTVIGWRVLNSNAVSTCTPVPRSTPDSREAVGAALDVFSVPALLDLNLLVREKKGREENITFKWT
jgi:hypothetical protein